MAVEDLAKRGDVVGLFGKGHELSMNLDGKREVAWSDRQVVQELLAKND
jgi:UDP-N-acetylmuramyl tripeptide synthase